MEGYCSTGQNPQWAVVPVEEEEEEEEEECKKIKEFSAAYTHAFLLSHFPPDFYISVIHKIQLFIA
jgi:hypothetical protein